MEQLDLRGVYQRLEQGLGTHHGWWPAESKEEIIVGAFLVQNTSWKNAQLALTNIRQHLGFDGHQLQSVALEDLAEWIRPSGFYKNKSQAIRQFFAWYQQAGGWEQALVEYGDQLRDVLLQQRGVGAETADVLLTYVFEQPCFIADKYAQKLFTHLTGFPFRRYEALAQAIVLDDSFSITEAQAFHGLIVAFGQHYFRGGDRFAESFLAGCFLPIK